jgi:hypothetical protein
MSNRISKVAQSSTVQEYAFGAAQGAVNILPVANFLAPTCNVASNYFRYWVYDLKNRFKIPDTRRAIGGPATQLKTGGSPVTATLEPFALDYPVDEFEASTDEGVADLINERADITAQLAALDWSGKVIAAALTAAGGGTNLSAATGGMDFVDQIDQKIIAVAKASMCGELCPVKVLVGPTAMRIFKNHSSTKDRFVAGGGDKGRVNPSTEDAMALLMGNPKFRISWITYDAADEGAAAAPTFSLDSQVLIFAGADNPTRVDPSFMKTFRPRNKWMVPGVYTREDGRGDVFKFDWWGLPVVTNSTAVARLNLTA